jgi:hypothetical protein
VLNALAEEATTTRGDPSLMAPTIDLGQRLYAVMLEWIRDQLTGLPGDGERRA